MEGRRRLRNPLAVPAGELLADGLNHLPLARDDFQRLGDVLAELRDPPGAATGACHRGLDHNPLAPQMFGECFTDRPAALERAHERRRPGRDLLGGKIVFARGRLELLELQLHLLKQTCPSLRPPPVKLTPQLQDLELERRDHRFGAGGDRPGRGCLGAGVGKGLAQTLDVFGRVLHDFDCTRCAKDVEVKVETLRPFLSSRRQWTPSPLRVPPVDPLEHVAELRRSDRHDAVRRRRPEEAPALQSLGVQRAAEPVVPKNLHKMTFAAPEHKKIACMRVAAEALLHLQRQAVHATPHIGHPGRQPDPDATRNRDHRRTSARSAAVTTAGSTRPEMRTRLPFGSSISITPPAIMASECGAASPVSARASSTGATSTAANAGATGTAVGRPDSVRNRLRQVKSWLVFTPWRWATACTVAPGTSVSATSRRFASSDQRRRACPRKFSTRGIPSPKDWSRNPLPDQSHGRSSRASPRTHRRPPPEGYVITCFVGITKAICCEGKQRRNRSLVRGQRALKDHWLIYDAAAPEVADCNTQR